MDVESFDKFLEFYLLLWVIDAGWVVFYML